jgi:hypothetical protein
MTGPGPSRTENGFVYLSVKVFPFRRFLKMADSRLKQLEKGTATLAMRMAIAEGLLPLEADELVEAFSILTHDPDPKVRTALQENLSQLPRGFLIDTAGKPDISPDFLHLIARELIDDDQILQSVILNRSVDDKTLVLVAEKGPPAVLEILAQNRNRMLENPHILKKLIENNQLSRVSRFSLEEFKERFEIDFDYMEEGDFDAVEPSGQAVATADGKGGEGNEAVAVDETGTDVTELRDELDQADELSTETSVADADMLEDAFAGEGDFIEFDDSAGQKDADDGVAVDDEQDISNDWDIEGFVKTVKGDATETGSDDTTGFDDVLDITLEEEAADTDEEDNWLGESVTEMGKRFGVDLEDEIEEIDEEGEEEESIRDTRVRLMRMRASEKLILAQLGTKQERAILVTDPNKKVAVAVVEGPKMSEFEIQMVAANRQVYEDVLRAIAKHRKWGKSPNIRRELVLNPKTPLDISVRMLSSLNDFTLNDVMKSKEVPSALAAQAKRVVEMREMRRGR